MVKVEFHSCPVRAALGIGESVPEGREREISEPCSERERLPERSLPPEYVPTRK